MTVSSDALNELKQMGQSSVKRGNTVNLILALLLLFLLGWGLIDWWLDRDLPRIRAVEISDNVLTVEKPLCRGDVLSFRFFLHIEGEGVLVRDTAVQQGSSTLIYSEEPYPLRYPVKGPIDEVVMVNWQVPTEYFDYVSGEMLPFPSGEFIFLYSVSSLSREVLSDQVPVTFRVLEDCNG